MRVLSSTITTLGLAALLGTTVMTSGCEFTKKVIAKDKLNQGAIAYNGGKTKVAESYFKEAVDMVPNNAVAWLYYGATQYKTFQGLGADERKQVAPQVLDTFKKALDFSNNDCKIRDSALGYISSIYSDLDDTDNNIIWMLKRADGECADKTTKAITYYSVGVKKWQCSNNQTNRYSDKKSQDPFHYRDMAYSPEALKDRDKAMQCANEGMQYIEKSLAEDPQSPDSKFYKALLYRELQYMTKEEPKRKEFGALAQKINDEAVALNKKKEAEKKAAEAAAAAASPQ
ncbi:MAG: hypothetical protein HOP19_25315 [Acidobacteria bacterium]|nr:hypothetical protein [Acidobacteriota bacterium]